VFLFVAIKMGSLALTNLILAYNVIITSFYGVIFLHEPAGVLTYTGFAIMIFALFLLKSPESDGEGKKNSLLWFLFALFGMLTSAGYSIITKAAQVEFNNTNNNEFIIIAIGFSAIANFIIGLSVERRDAFKTLKTCGPYAAAAGVANGATNLLVILINSLIAISIATPTRSLMTKILNFVLGYFIFKEKYTKKQIIGLVLVCAAVVMININ
jgi:drug/metabolite transporter (DMT)-like permease